MGPKSGGPAKNKPSAGVGVTDSRESLLAEHYYTIANPPYPSSDSCSGPPPQRKRGPTRSREGQRTQSEPGPRVVVKREKGRFRQECGDGIGGIVAAVRVIRGSKYRSVTDGVECPSANVASPPRAFV